MVQDVFEQYKRLALDEWEMESLTKIRMRVCLTFALPVLLALALATSYNFAVGHELGLDIQARGGVAKLCIESMDFNMESSRAPYWHRTYFGASRLYAEICESLYHTLDEDQKRVLGTLLDKDLSWSVKFRPEWDDAWWPIHSNNASREREREQLRNQSPKSRYPPGRSAAEHLAMLEGHYNLGENWTAILGLKGTPSWIDTFEKLADRTGGPIMEPFAKPSEILGFLQRGQPVRFDATKIIPRSQFNTSIIDLKRMHGEMAKGIPILGYDPGTKCRVEFAWQQKRLVPAAESWACPKPFTLDQVDSQPMFGGPRINLRRLPKLVDVDEMIVRGLGLQDIVERASGQLNMGHSGGEPHWDEQDNIFIGINGVNVIFVVPQNYTDAADGYKGAGYGTPVFEWLSKDDFRKDDLPYHIVILRPGEGLLIPSRSYHTVLGTHDRLGINTFLEPRYKRMTWSSNPQSHWHRETEERKALRNLWVKTIKTMWDTRKLSIHIQGYNLEML